MQEPMNESLTDTLLALAKPALCGEKDGASKIGAGVEPETVSLPWRDAFLDNLVSVAGTNLVGARCKEGLTQAELSQRAGIPVSRISQIENGNQTIATEEAYKLANILNISSELLLGSNPSSGIETED